MTRGDPVSSATVPPVPGTALAGRWVRTPYSAPDRVTAFAWSPG